MKKSWHTNYRAKEVMGLEDYETKKGHTDSTSVLLHLKSHLIRHTVAPFAAFQSMQSSIALTKCCICKPANLFVHDFKMSLSLHDII